MVCLVLVVFGVCGFFVVGWFFLTPQALQATATSFLELSDKVGGKYIELEKVFF